MWYQGRDDLANQKFYGEVIDQGNTWGVCGVAQLDGDIILFKYSWSGIPDPSGRFVASYAEWMETTNLSKMNTVISVEEQQSYPSTIEEMKRNTLLFEGVLRDILYFNRNRDNIPVIPFEHEGISPLTIEEAQVCFASANIERGEFIMLPKPILDYINEAKKGFNYE